MDGDIGAGYAATILRNRMDRQAANLRAAITAQQKRIDAQAVEIATMKQLLRQALLGIQVLCTALEVGERAMMTKFTCEGCGFEVVQVGGVPDEGLCGVCDAISSSVEPQWLMEVRRRCEAGGWESERWRRRWRLPASIRRPTIRESPLSGEAR